VAFVEHSHRERNHQGLQDRLIIPTPMSRMAPSAVAPDSVGCFGTPIGRIRLYPHGIAPEAPRPSEDQVLQQDGSVALPGALFTKCPLTPQLACGIWLV